MGLRQVDDFPFVDSITLAKYNQDRIAKRVTLRIEDFQSKTIEPDLVLYLIASDKQFISSDIAYLRDLLRKNYPIVYVFNCFGDRETGTHESASPQNLEDITRKLNKIHEVLEIPDPPVIANVNCWTGKGISDLVQLCYRKLGDDKGRLLFELMEYQIQKTPSEYLARVKANLLTMTASVACYKTSHLSTDVDNVLNFVAGQPEHLDNSEYEFIGSKVRELITAKIETHYEKVIQQRSKKIYKSVPVFKTIHEEINDYSRPIYREEVIWKKTSNPFKKLKNEWKYGSSKKPITERYCVGYHKKTETRQVHVGYREEYSHTEYWQEETGELRAVGTTYHHLDKDGVALVLTLVHLAIFAGLHGLKGKAQLETQYTTLYNAFLERGKHLPKFPSKPTEERILEILKTHQDRLFEPFLDEAIATSAPVRLQLKPFLKNSKFTCSTDQSPSQASDERTTSRASLSGEYLGKPSRQY
ncbi:MAG: hypothetical protein LRZ84_13110 [Desertifilum sp.]|nr:hypothetical protein [Desertifilum sp.]